MKQETSMKSCTADSERANDSKEDLICLVPGYLYLDFKKVSYRELN